MHLQCKNRQIFPAVKIDAYGRFFNAYEFEILIIFATLLQNSKQLAVNSGQKQPTTTDNEQQTTDE